MLTSPAARRLSAAAALVFALVGSVVLAAPAQAAEKVVRITAEGLVPGQLTIARGDTVVLVNDDAAFRYRARSTTGNWSFDSGLIPLASGVRYALPEITDSGTYGFTVFQGEDPFNGAVVLPAPRSSPAPRASAGPTRGASAAPSPAAVGSASPTPSPSVTGGTGATALPPLPGGFGSSGTVPSPVPGGTAQLPDLAPVLPLLPGETAGPSPETAGEPSPSPAVITAVRGDLPGAGTSRGYGLPAVLAAVLAAGIASLLVRLLLAEPPARRAVAGLSGPDPVATVD